AAVADCAHLPRFFEARAAPRDVHPFPTRRSSDLSAVMRAIPASICSSGARADASSRSTASPASPFGAISKAGISAGFRPGVRVRSEEHTSELQSRFELVCRLLLEKTKGRKKADE